MARIALIDPSGRSTTTVQAVLGRTHEVLVRTKIHAPGDCDLVIADLRHDDLCDTAILRSLSSFGPVLLLVERMQPIPTAVEESADLSVLRKPFDAFELRLCVQRLLRAVAFPGSRPVVQRLEDEDAQWLEFPFVPAPAGAVLRRAAKLPAPLWILGEPGSGRRRVAMAVCRSVDPALRVVTLFPDEHLAAVLHREEEEEPFALLVPDVERRPLLEQERLALLLGGEIGFRLIATSVEDAGERVLAGAFSRSLYQHLCGLAVQLSPLRERPVTIPPLVQALVRRIARRLAMGDDVSFAPDAMARLQTYMWPGNLLELEAVLNRTLVHAVEKDVRARGIEADEILFMPDDVGRPRPAVRTSSPSTLARLPAAATAPVVPRASVLDIRQVVAGLAHDLRNPMTTIKAFASTLDAADSDVGDTRRLGELASEACTRIDGYLDALQRYTDLPAPSPRVSDLREIVTAVVRRAEGGDERVQLAARGDPLRAICDPEQMEYVLDNVLAALRAEIDASASISVRAEAGGLTFEAPAGRGASTKLRELVAEGVPRALTWRMLLAQAVSERNGFVVEEELAGNVLRIRCRPVRGEVESRNEQTYRNDR